MTDVPHPAVAPLNDLQLERGAELGRRLHVIAADVTAWADEVDASNADRLLRVQTYSDRVLAGLQSVGTDLGILTMAMAEGPPR